MTKLKKNNIILVRLLTIFLIIFFLSLILYKSFPVFAQKIDNFTVIFTHDKESNCPSSKYFVDLFNRQISEDHQLKIEQYAKRGGVFYWMLSKDSPHFGYNDKTGFDGIVGTANDNIKLISQLILESIDPNILTIGFERSDINSFYKDKDSYLGGYEKGDTIIALSLSQGGFYDPEIGMSISLYCGKRNKDLDATYLDLASSKTFISDLEKVQKVSSASGLYFGINKVHQDNVIDIFSGQTEVWFHKIGKDWVQIFESQDGIFCSVLEKYKVEPGIDCWDTRLKIERVTK